MDKEDNWQAYLFSAQGERLSDKPMSLMPQVVWWDADELREITMGSRIFKYEGDILMDNFNKGERDMLFVGDIIGDWREEIIVSLPGEIRIYSTTIPANTRKVCLMQDHQYRMDVASASVGYNTSPQLGLQKNSKKKYSKE
jgi:rhamnogalacturonan endolyase